QTVMSALPPKADMCGARGNVRFGPIADIRRAPIAERPYHPQASELLARVSRSVLDLLDDLIKVPALGALKRRKLFVTLELLEPQLLADGQDVPVVYPRRNRPGDRPGGRTRNRLVPFAHPRLEWN